MKADFVKEDSCGAYQNPDKAIPEYILMRDALNKTGRPIFFSLCGWHDWCVRAAAAHSTR